MSHPTTPRAALITPTALLAAVLAWGAFQMDAGPSAGATAASLPPVPAAAGLLIDHGVLDDPDRLPEADPAPRAVAAYGA